MNLSLKRLAWLFLFLPVPLGLWIYHLRFISVENLDSQFPTLPDAWYASLAIAAILQSLIFLPVARTRPRSLSTVLIPTVLLFASLFVVGSISLNSREGDFTKYVFEASPWSPAALVWLLVLISFLAVVGYSGSLLARNLPTLRHLREMKLISWTGLALIGIIASNVIALTFAAWRNQGPVIVSAAIMILTTLLTWKLADEWWRNTPVMLGLLTTVSASFFLLVALLSTIRPPGVPAGIVGFTFSLLYLIGIVSLFVLSIVGLRFALHYFPRPQRLREAGLLDWRGVLFGSGLVLACMLIIAAGSSFLSVDSGWPIFWVLCVGAIALYWRPAKAWQQKPEPAYLLAAVAIPAAGAGFVLWLLSPTPTPSSLFASEPRSNIQNINLMFFAISQVLALGCGLVALLPWFRHLIEEEWPTFRERMGLAGTIMALLLVTVGFASLLDQHLNRYGSRGVNYFVLTGGFMALAAYLLTPLLSRFGKRRWLAGIAAALVILAFFATLALILSDKWPSDREPSWVGNYQTIFFLFMLCHLLMALCFALLMPYSALLRGVLTFLLFATIGVIFIVQPWDLPTSGSAAIYVWLGCFGVGWLLAPFLPRRTERWLTFCWSGLLLLLLSLLLLPLFFRESQLVTYDLSFLIWAKHKGMFSADLWHTGLLATVVSLFGTFLFAVLVRSGQAVLARSRNPKPEAITIGVLLLAGCLAVAASYYSSQNVVVNRLNDNLWSGVIVPAALTGKVSQLFVDHTGAIWIGTVEGGVARFDGNEWRTYTSEHRLSEGKLNHIYEDGEGRIWIVTDKGVNEFDRDTGDHINSDNLKNIGLPEEVAINVIYQDQQNRLLLGTSQGVYSLRERSWVAKVSDGWLGFGVRQIGEDADGNLWYRTEYTVYIHSSIAQERVRQLKPDTELTYPLDLTTVPPETEVTLTLLVRFPFQGGSRYGLLDVLAAGGEEWKCIEPETGFQSFYEERNCPAFTNHSDYIFNVSYDLSEYVGQTIELRLTSERRGSSTPTGSWHLLGSGVWRGADLERIPLDAWRGSAEWVVDSDEITLAERNRSDKPTFTWHDNSDEIYYASTFGVRQLGDFGLEMLREPLLNDEDSPLEVSAVFQDTTTGDIWLGAEDGSLRFSTDGRAWQTFSEGELTKVTAILKDDDTLWVAGEAQIGEDQRHVIAQYALEADSKPEQARIYNTATSGLAVGTVQTLVADKNGNIWALIKNDTWIPNSTLWFVLPVLLLAGLGYREYDRQSLTQAQRLSRKLRATPERTVALLYSQLQNGPEGGDVLRHVADESSLMVSGECSKLAGALVMLASDQPLASSETLGTVARELALASEMPHAAELGVFYGFLAEALGAKTSGEIATWPLKEIRGAESALLISQTCEPIRLPPFVGSQSVRVLESLSEAADILGKSIQVDNSQDKVVYLADALSAAERAARAAIVLSPPEGRILQAIAQQWAEIIHAELNTLSGRAELRLELRTRQVRRAAQVTLALRVENAGRATAEKVIVSLVPDGFALAGEAQLTLTQLSSGGSAPVEFAVTPLNGGTARVACRVSWDDRVSEGNVIQFADVVRFYEGTEAFQPIPNPYIVGPPVKSAKIFHGREDVFGFIADNLSGAVQDRTFVLHGQRRTGKTSILYQLVDGRLGPNFVPVLIDMQELVLDIESTGDFLNEVAYQLARAARKAEIAIDAPPLERFASAPTRAFNRFLDALEDLLGERHVLVMFDEFELIESKIAEGKLDPNLLGYFRSLMQHRSRLVFFFTGTHRLEEMSHDYWSILFNIALYRRVSFLKEAEAVRLIRQPVAGKLDVDELAVEKIMRLTSGHPYFIQLICWSLVNYCNAQERNYATINDVNATVQEILMSGQAHFAYIWQQAPPSHRLALAAVAHTLQPGKMWARPVEILTTLAASGDTQTERSTLTKSLDHLAQQQVLECATEGVLRYRFQIEVLRLWVKESKSIALLLERKS